MNNALNSFLQSEISNIAGKALDISLGMETVDNAEDGGKRTDYNFQFAKRIMGTLRYPFRCTARSATCAAPEAREGSLARFRSSGEKWKSKGGTDVPPFRYSTVTLFARFLGLSMSQPRWRAT